MGTEPDMVVEQQGQSKSLRRLLWLSAMVAWSYVILGMLGLLAPLFMGFNWLSFAGALAVTALGIYELRARTLLRDTREYRYAWKLVRNQIFITFVVAAGVLYPLMMDPVVLVEQIRTTAPDVYPTLVQLCAAMDTTPEEYFGIVLRLSSLITFVLIVPLQCCITYYYHWLSKRI